VLAQLTSETQAQLTSEAQAQLTSEVQARLTSEAQAQLTSEAQAQLTSEAQAQLTSEAQAQLTFEAQAQLTSEAQALHWKPFPMVYHLDFHGLSVSCETSEQHVHEIVAWMFQHYLRFVGFRKILFVLLCNYRLG
jgi:DNA-nicking Smr family endonuclease